MEWKTPYHPKDGDTRERIKFAWLPMECADGITRWLCNVRVVEEYETWYDMEGGGGAAWIIKRVYRAEVRTLK